MKALLMMTMIALKGNALATKSAPNGSHKMSGES
jgi:hypothetical protein